MRHGHSVTSVLAVVVVIVVLQPSIDGIVYADTGVTTLQHQQAGDSALTQTTATNDSETDGLTSSSDSGTATPETATPAGFPVSRLQPVIPNNSEGGPPSDGEQLTLDTIESSLSVGSEGAISGTLTNNGSDAIRNAALVFTGNASDITPRQSTVSLGDLDSGASTYFEYSVRVRDGVAPGERQVPFVVRYQTETGTTRRSEPLYARVTISESATDFEVVDVNSDLESGERGTISVQIENTEDADDVVVTLRSVSDSVQFGNARNTSRFVGDLNSGETVTINVDATASADSTPGEYPVQASLSYTDAENQPTRTDPVTFGVEVDERTDDIEIVSTTTDVSIGGRGTVTLTLTNAGSDMTEATVSLASLSPDLMVGPNGNATRFVGEWDAGEQRTVVYSVRASNDTERRSHPLRIGVSYTDTDGMRARSDERIVGVTPRPEQTFRLTNVSGNLSVGDEGTVTGTLVNEGPRDVRNAVLTVASPSNINPLETTFSLGALAVGEATTVSFPMEVADGTDGGPRQLSFTVGYDTPAGDSYTRDTLTARIGVASERDEFTITRRNASVEIGGRNTVMLEITNNRNSTVRNVNAKAFVDDPLSLSDDEGFVTALAPGATATITVEVSATEQATPGTYPLSIDFQYDTVDGESKLSETYDVPIDVREPASDGLLAFSSGLPIAPILLVVLIGIAAVAFIRQRNDSDDENTRDV